MKTILNWLQTHPIRKLAAITTIAFALALSSAILDLRIWVICVALQIFAIVLIILWNKKGRHS